MIKNYYKFNENLSNININDRVITHGKIIHNIYYNYVDIEGKTGRIIDKINNNISLILFDDYFKVDFYTDNNNYLVRSSRINNNNLEKIYFSDKGKNIFFTDKARKLIEYFEYIDCPFENVNINYIDITDKNDTISFLRDERFNRVKTGEDVFNNNLRMEMKIGKFLQMINPYANKETLDRKINYFKSSYNSIISKKSTFKVVKGIDIVNWYNESNYAKGNGSLNKSCMRYDLGDKLNLYRDNPDIVSMLILINEKNELEGRALIWNVHEPDIIYMDRIYTVYQETVHMFQEYAKNRGYKIYDQNNIEPMRIHFSYDLGDGYDNPYMDTFNTFFIDGYYGTYYLSNIIDENDLNKDSYYRIFDET